MNEIQHSHYVSTNLGTLSLHRSVYCKADARNISIFSLLCAILLFLYICLYNNSWARLKRKVPQFSSVYVRRYYMQSMISLSSLLIYLILYYFYTFTQKTPLCEWAAFYLLHLYSQNFETQMYFSYYWVLCVLLRIAPNIAFRSIYRVMHLPMKIFFNFGCAWLLFSCFLWISARTWPLTTHSNYSKMLKKSPWSLCRITQHITVVLEILI